MTYSIISLFLLSSYLIFTSELDLVKTSGLGIIVYEKWYINRDIKDSKHLGGSTNFYGASAEKYKNNYIIKTFSNFTDREIPVKDLYKVKRSDKYWHQNSSREKYMQAMINNREQNIKITLCIDDPLFDKHIIVIRDKIQFYSGDGYLRYTLETREEFEKKERARVIEDSWEDDPNQFYYKKDRKGNFFIYRHISKLPTSKEYAIIPIKECFSDGWCLTYRSGSGDSLYVKKAALIKYKN